jgi:predicted transcriptional regulator
MAKKKEPVVTTVRLDPAVLIALDKAARADNRTRSSMLQKFVIDALKEQGFLK